MSAASAAAAAAAVAMSRSSSSNSSTTSADSPRMMTSYHPHHQQTFMMTSSEPSIAHHVASAPPQLSRYESQKRRDWITFGQYLKNHRPPLNLSGCSGAHVLEFLRYLDQFGKTKVHVGGGSCPFYGHPNPPAPCPCPLKQAWGSLDALIGRLRAAFEENGGLPEMNLFGARAVRLYLREVRDTQAKARGIAYEKKKRKKPTTTTAVVQHEDEQGQRGHFVSGGYGGGGGGGVTVFGGGGTVQPNGVVLGGARGSMRPLSVLNR